MAVASGGGGVVEEGGGEEVRAAAWRQRSYRGTSLIRGWEATRFSFMIGREATGVPRS